MRTRRFFMLLLAAAAVMASGCSDGSKNSEKTPYAVTVSNDGNGAAIANYTQAYPGTEVSLSAMAKDGYVFKGWTVVSGEVSVTNSANASAKFTMPETAVHVKAEFDKEEVKDVFTVISDIYFRTYCERFDTNKDGKLSPAEAKAVTKIDLRIGNVKNVASLAGIEYFPSLTQLYCGSNQLTALDLSKNTELVELYCSENRLTSLDVSKNTKLTALNCASNRLASLSINNNTELLELYCSSNSLTTLNVSNNVKLTLLYCASNSLTSLDLSKNSELKYLSCIGNKLTGLSLSSNYLLNTVYCSGNQLTSLDMSRNTLLLRLDCSANRLSALDISICTNMLELKCNSNPSLYQIKVWKGFNTVTPLSSIASITKDSQSSFVTI